MADPLSLVSPTEATSGELCPVLGFPVHKRYGPWSGPSRVQQKRLRDRSIHHMREGWESWEILGRRRKYLWVLVCTNSSREGAKRIDRGFFSGAQWEHQWQRTQTETQGVPLEHQQPLLHCEGNRLLTQVIQRNCGVAILEEFQNPPGHSPR